MPAAPRVGWQLRPQGLPVSDECVRRSLQRQGLCPVGKRPRRVTTDLMRSPPVALIRRKVSMSVSVRLVPWRQGLTNGGLRFSEPA